MNPDDHLPEGATASDVPATSDPMGRTDLEAWCLALPEVTNDGTATHPAFAVRGRKFVIFRGLRKDAVDPDSGELMPDVIAIVVPGPQDKEAILQSGAPWFTTRHFDGYNYVLVRERDLGRLDGAELREVIIDAWASRAPRRTVKEYLG